MDYAIDFNARLGAAMMWLGPQSPNMLLEELSNRQDWDALSKIAHEPTPEEPFVFLRFAIDFLMDHEPGTPARGEDFANWVLSYPNWENPIDLQTLVQAVGPIVSSCVTCQLLGTCPQQCPSAVTLALAIEEEE